MNKTFLWNHHRLYYFDHSYNHTSLNMRRVEVPIARWFLAQAPAGARVLEFGNVLAHYGPVSWPVLDLHEKGAINRDVMAWTPKEPYDYLVSISTAEHVGFGRYARPGVQVDPVDVLLRLRDFLSIGGQMLATMPLRYNPFLDAALLTGKLPADQITFMRFVGDGNWKECTRDEALAMSPRACAGRWSGGMMVLQCQV